MDHDERVRAIRGGFARANGQLIADIEAIDETAAAARREDGWNPAQIGWHVAVTNEFLAGAMSGRIPEMNLAKPPDFEESLATRQLPDKIKTFPRLEPPESASKAEAIRRLRTSGETFQTAVDTITRERAASAAVQMPFGVFSVYEVGEFTAAHVHRHIGQLKQTVGSKP